MPKLFQKFARGLLHNKKLKSIFNLSIFTRCLALLHPSKIQSYDKNKNRILFRPEILEDRTVPAFVTQNGFDLTIDLDTAGETVSLYSDSNSNIQFAVTGGTFVFSGGSPSPSNTFGFGLVSAGVDILITDSAANTAVVFADSGSFTNPTRITATLDDPAAGSITFNGNTTFVGNGGVTASTSRNVVVSSGAVLSTSSGNVILAANQQASPTSGGFAGVLVNGTVETVNGDITLQGRGGDASGGQQFGVYLPGGTVQATGTGKVTVTGQGGVNAGAFNGGVALAFGGKIVGGTSGANSVIGTGGASDGSQNDGVFAQDSTSVITTNGGNLTVTGTGGGTSGSSSNRGVILANGARIAAGDTGSVTVQGTGGTGIGNNTGVALNNTGSTITSSGGAVSVTGAANSGNNAVEINSGTTLSSGANASVTITADSLVVNTSATPGTVSAGTGSLTIRQRTDGTQINLGGSDAAGVLGLTNGELGNVTAGTLQIGNASSGAITISDDIAPSNVSTLRLTTGANVVDGNASGTDITVSNLGITAGTGVASSADPLETAVSSLTATTTTGGFFVTDTGTLSVGTISAPGNINISASGTMDVADAVQSSAGNVTLTTTGAGSNVAYGGSGFSNALAGTLTINSSAAITHAGVGDDIRASAVVLNAVTGIGVAGTPLEMSAGSVTATNTTSGDVVLRLNSNGFSTTTASAANTAATGNVTITRVGGTQLTVTSATTTTGSVTLGTNGASLSLTGVSAGGANQDVAATTTGAGNITVGSVAATRLVTLTTGGSIRDDGSSATAVTAPSLALTAVTGIGTSAAPVNTNVDNVEATTSTGGVFLSNTGAMTIGGVNTPLTGVRVTGGSGAVQIAATGTLMVSEGVQAPGNITLQATGGTSDLITEGGSLASTSSSAGTTRLEAGRDVLLGTVGGFGDVRGQGLVLEADRDIVVDAATYVQADGAAGLSATAGGDIRILQSLSAGSVLNSNGNGPISLTTGTGGTFVLDQGNNGGVGANGQNITINSDNIDLISGGIGTTATVTLTTLTAGRGINLGTNAAGSLGLTGAELNLVSAGTLVIGATTVGTLTVSSDLSRSVSTNVQIVSGGDIIQNSAAGSINTGGGTLSFSPGAASSYKPNRSNTDATSSTVSIASGGDLNINIAGVDVDSKYTRLTVDGALSLNGVDLLLTGGYVPNTGEVFTIVSATSVTGTFNGYVNNSVITLNGKTLRVNYTATSVTLTTIGVPTANAQSVTVGQDGTNFPIMLTGSDPNTSPVLTLTFIVTEQPAHGTLSGSGASLIYTPNAGYSGPDSFKFKTNNGFLDSTEVTVSITVAEAPTVSDLTPTAWTINQSGFTGSLTISGGTSGYTVTNQTGLPPGLTAVVNGAGDAIVFTGSPTSVGEFNGSVTLTDANGAVVTNMFTITINPALAITNLTTTAWTVGRAGFTGTLTLSGGTPANTITTQTGLPTGLTAVLSGNTISFVGVPSSTGNFNGSIIVTDGGGAQVTKTFTIMINSTPTFSLAANALPKYTVGLAYNRSINVTGGTGALTLAVASISAPLPTGMSLKVSGSRYIFSGIPRVLRTAIRITLIATDTTGVQTTIVYTLTGQQSPTRRQL